MSLLNTVFGDREPVLPLDEDTTELWRELETIYLSLDHTEEISTIVRHISTGKPSDPNWFPRFDALLKRHAAALSALEALEVPPRPRHPLFRIRRHAGRSMAGIYLTEHFWSYIFVSLLQLAKSVLRQAEAEGDYAKAVGKTPDRLLLLLTKRAAEVAGWPCPPEVLKDWQTVKRQYRCLANVGRAPEHMLPENHVPE